MSAGKAGQPSLLFTPGESLLHRANPITSLALMLWMISAAAVLPTIGTTILTAAAILVSLVTGVGKRAVKRLLLTTYIRRDDSEPVANREALGRLFDALRAMYAKR